MAEFNAASDKIETSFRGACRFNRHSGARQRVARMRARWQAPREPGISRFPDVQLHIWGLVRSLSSGGAKRRPVGTIPEWRC